MKALRAIALAAVLLASALSVAQSWQPLNHQPAFTAGAMALLTDGTVLVHEEVLWNGKPQWYKLTPDINGS